MSDDVEMQRTMPRWLREEVVPVAAAMQVDPERSIPADRVFDEIRELHAKRGDAPRHGA